MAKELTIPQGIYKVGVDFPEGSYVFNSKDVKTHIDLETRNDDYTCFDFDDKKGYEARIALNKGETLTLHTKMYVTKAEPLNFD